MNCPDPLSRWLLSQVPEIICDSVPGIDPHPEPEPEPKPDPDPPEGSDFPGTDPGFPSEPISQPSPISARECVRAI
jgi:hypothetical protein